MALSRRTPMPRGKGLDRGSAPLTRGAPPARSAPLRARSPLPRTRAPRDDDARETAQPARTSAPRARAPLARTTPMPRTAPAPTGATPGPRKPRTRVAAAAADTGPSQATRALVNARDGGLCVRCGAPASDLDHRSGRGAGGRKGAELARINTAAWLITLCGLGASSGCHKWKEDERHAAERQGWRIARNGPRVEAEDVPVLTRWGWRLATLDGRWAPCPAPPDGDARPHVD